MKKTSSYRPLMSDEDAERIRVWHERAYQAAKQEGTADKVFTYFGRTILIPPLVMPITPVSHLLGEAVLREVRTGDRVLDMGTGSGVNAILAAGASRVVVAVDISPAAVAAATANAERNRVADRIDVHLSDVFSDVEGKFDLMIFDPPFRWFAPRDLLEAATTDHDYRALTTFFNSAKNYLAPGGRLLVFFGSTGDIAYLRRLIDLNGFSIQKVANKKLENDQGAAEYFTFRLTA